MILTVNRTIQTQFATCGSLLFDGIFFCYTLEPFACIAAGIYRARVCWSPKFQRNTPRLFDVPGYPNNDVEIHMGNYPENTEGCILVGSIQGSNYVGDSDATLDALMKKLPAPGIDFQVETSNTFALV
jgi:hypothetical protein